jgi:hypothetical protein
MDLWLSPGLGTRYGPVSRPKDVSQVPAIELRYNNELLEKLHKPGDLSFLEANMYTHYRIGSKDEEAYGNAKPMLYYF